MPVQKEKQPDQKRIVARLAEEFHEPVDDVATLYEHERAQLATGAHLTKFLHIFAVRNVQEILRQRRIDKAGVAGSQPPTDPCIATVARTNSAQNAIVDIAGHRSICQQWRVGSTTRS